MDRRVRFVLIYFVLLPPVLWFGFYGGTIAYHWATGRGGLDSATLMAWGAIVVYAITLLSNGKQVWKRLTR